MAIRLFLSLCEIELCLNNKFTQVCLPVHSSHMLQPLDVGIYGHVKETNTSNFFFS